MWIALQNRLARPAERLRARYSSQAHERLRLNALFAVALFKLLNFFGGNWDIQWHVAVGRDSLWIPPHLMVLAAFSAGSLIVLSMIAYETYLKRQGAALKGVVRLGFLSATPAFYGILFGYSAALLSGVFDEMWHRTFGIDATLWSPPHLCIMAATTLVDLSLLVGIANSARRLKKGFEWRSPLLWGLALVGAYTLESVNFQMSQAFITGYRAGGAGLMGILFPLMVGAVFPLALLLNIRLAGRFWVAILLFFVAITLQYAGTGIASLGFAILKPASEIEMYVRLNPESTIAKAREFAQVIGFNGLIGFQQAWAMWLSALPLALVSSLELWPWARRHPLVAAPVFSASMVLVSSLWFQRIPVMQDYPVTWAQVLLGVFISVAAGLLTGSLGLWLAKRALKYEASSEG